MFGDLYAAHSPYKTVQNTNRKQFKIGLEDPVTHTQTNNSNLSVGDEQPLNTTQEVWKTYACYSTLMASEM